MRKSKKFIGMPVISLAEGQQLGTVKGLVVDPTEQKVAALIIEQKGWFKEQKFAPYGKVRSVGTDAITIDQSAVVEKGASLPDILKLYKDKIAIISCKVLAENGAQLGVVDEYYVDETNGNIVGLELSGTLLNSLMKGKTFLDISFVKTIGKELVVTLNDASENLVKSDGGLQETVKQLKDSTSQLWDSTVQITKELGTKTKEISTKTVEELESKTKDLGNITKDLGENLLEKVRGKNKDASDGVEDSVSVHELPDNKLKRQEEEEELTRQTIEDSVQVVDLPPEALKRQEEELPEEQEDSNSETSQDLNPQDATEDPAEKNSKKE